MRPRVCSKKCETRSSPSRQLFPFRFLPRAFLSQPPRPNVFLAASTFLLLNGQLSRLCTFPSRTLFSCRDDNSLPVFSTPSPFSPFALHSRFALASAASLSRVFLPLATQMPRSFSPTRVIPSFALSSVSLSLPLIPRCPSSKGGSLVSVPHPVPYRRLAFSDPSRSRGSDGDAKCAARMVGRGAMGLAGGSVALREGGREGRVAGDVVGAGIVTVLNERPR